MVGDVRSPLPTVLVWRTSAHHSHKQASTRRTARTPGRWPWASPFCRRRGAGCFLRSWAGPGLPHRLSRECGRSGAEERGRPQGGQLPGAEVRSPGRRSSGAAPSPGNQPSPPQEPAGPWTPQRAPSRCCRSSCSSARKESGFGGTGFVTVMRLEKALRAGREGTGAPSELLLEAVARPGKVVTPADRLQPPQPSHLRHGAPGGNPSYDRTPAHRQGDSHVGTRRASRPLPSITAPHKGKSEEQASASILPLSPVN
ncbi:uncharacterized protein [Chlorocebus sabaeus]|uniref:uncharacterized protein n=1 Tax=Chlorocebus sabaeus TaxID=60711 RepID=UPI003BF9CE91